VSLTGYLLIAISDGGLPAMPPSPNSNNFIASRLTTARLVTP
jgi:hypothetical protein